MDDCSNDAELRADLTAMQESDGGTLTFSCETTTIVLTADLPVISKGTTIDGGGKITISGAGARRIFVVQGATTLSNLVLTGGSSSGDGGAIYSESVVVLHNVVIRDSVAGLGGGALRTVVGVIEDSELHSNEAASGGAIAAIDGALVIERSWIHDNKATGTSDGWGGGVSMVDVSAAIEDSMLSGNSAEKCGAGLYVAEVAGDAVLSMLRTRVTGNVCKSGDGAGIRMDGKALAMDQSEISGNETPGNGGGLSLSNAAVAIAETTFAENSSGAMGGAALVADSVFSGENLTISSNHASSAGGLRIENSTVALLNLTVASNEGTGDGAIDYIAAGEYALQIKNLLLADNEEPNVALAGSGGAAIASGGGNVSDDDSGSAVLTLVNDVRSAQTLLGPLRLHGGIGRTHVPQPGSDAVDPELVTSGPTTDQRGIVRPQGPSSDAGAVEVVPCGDITATCGDANDNGTISSSDALKALRTAVDADECALWSCDYDGNGSVSSVDALAILRESVGLATTPSCPPVWDCHTP